MKLTKIALIPVFLLFFVLGISQSYANQYEFFTDRAAFQAEYPDLKIQNFSQSKVSPSTFEACTSPVNSNSNDDCFSPGDIMSGLDFVGGAPSSLTLLLIGANGIGINNPNNSLVANNNNQRIMDIIFNNDNYTIVSLELGCSGPQVSTCSEPVRVEVFGFGPVLLGSTTIDVTDDFETFLGITADEPIARIALSPVNPVAIFPGVSEVRFGMMPRNVPTMSEWGMIATVAGLAIIGFVVLRRRKALN